MKKQEAESNAVLEKSRRIATGEDQPKRLPPVDPERVPLYGGISGLSLAVGEFALFDGLIVRETYAHVMAPYIVALARPKKPGAPHPGPWKAARGGLGFDVTIEVALSETSRPTGLDRLNTLWWVLALLRLVTGAPLRMPVVSDIAFTGISSSSAEPTLWTIEMPPRQLRITRDAPKIVTTEHLEWVRDTLIDGAKLLDNEEFNRAFQTFDAAIWAHSNGSAIVMAWATLETLFRPGRQQITKMLAKCIATFLNSAGAARDRAYQKIEKLYEARGSAAHDSQVPEAEQLLDSFELARRSLAKCLDLRDLPDASALLSRWASRQ